MSSIQKSIINDRSPARSIEKKYTFQDVIIDKMSIYPGTEFLYLETLKQQTLNLKYPLNISFEISGNSSLQVIASLDTSSLNGEEINFISGLFVEGMNILIGNMVTNLDQLNHQNNFLSSPKKIEINGLTINEDKYSNFAYLLKYKEKSFPILLSFSEIIKSNKRN